MAFRPFSPSLFFFSLSLFSSGPSLGKDSSTLIPGRRMEKDESRRPVPHFKNGTESIALGGYDPDTRSVRTRTDLLYVYIYGCVYVCVYR